MQANGTSRVSKNDRQLILLKLNSFLSPLNQILVLLALTKLIQWILVRTHKA